MPERERVLFCNVAYMEYYDSSIKEETPQNGGGYVVENKTGGEINNFHLYDDDRYHGFVEPGFTNDKQNQLHIENIDPAYKGKDAVPDVTVIFCAAGAAGSVIVGWYRRATVFRHMQTTDNGATYNILAAEGNAVLLDESDRKMKVPRGRTGKGLGQHQYWFAKDDSGNRVEYASRVLEYIRDFSPEDNLLFDRNPSEDEPYDKFEISLYAESARMRMVSVGVRERNVKARNACLKRRGHRCLVCGFDAKEVYGDTFEGKIHVHHIVPMSQRNAEYTIDPEKDLIPVCPNCHMMLHTKVDGKLLSPEELKKVLRKHYKEVEEK